MDSWTFLRPDRLYWWNGTTLPQPQHLRTGRGRRMILVDAPRRTSPRFSLAVAARTRWAVASTLGLFASLLAVAGSWIPSLWGDEAASLMSAERPLPSLFRMLGHVDAVHGTYYLGLHWWIAVAGTSPFAIRLPSAIAVGFAVAGTVAIAWRLADRRIAVIAGLVCALLPGSHTWARRPGRTPSAQPSPSG
ncbi:hypothetical protein [Leifsonia poae]|uniref:hypothetical protein n=1 Tax=Leifsonia poae TaxID=110933 RepID=UPI003D67DF7A